MADQAKTYWTSEPAHGTGGRYRVVVSRLAGGKGAARDQFSATLFRRGESGEEAVETDFWHGTTPPHDLDKVRFREKAKRAADSAAPESSPAPAEQEAPATSE